MSLKSKSSLLTVLKDSVILLRFVFLGIYRHYVMKPDDMALDGYNQATH